MQVLIVVDSSGAVVAVCRRTLPERGLQAGIKPVEQGHKLHLLDLPLALEQVPLHELVKRIHVRRDGTPNLDPA